MELRDLIVTPIVIFLVYAGAYWIRPRVTDAVNRKYFIPALTVRIIGALAVGFLYQFYYDGGDTFNFHTHGSRILWESFWKAPNKVVKILFGNGELSGDTFGYTSQILFYGDESSFFIVKIATLFDFLTFSSYSATAVLFATISFVGMWLLFLSFYRLAEDLHAWVAAACFFIPSVFFWGSGLLKDTVTIACLGMIVFSVSNIFLMKRFSVGILILLVASVLAVFVVKKYVLLCLLPAIFIWIYSEKLNLIRSMVLRLLLIPFVMLAVIASGYFAVLKIGEGDERYALDKIAKTSKITAYDIGFYTGRDAGSGYSLGELDGTFLSMISLAPSAINVALFRPYIWEVRNPLMLLSCIESIAIIGLVIYTIFKKGAFIFNSFTDPRVLFCLIFSLTFAFAVGVSTFNFGSLARYKIPMLPFFVMGVAFMLNYSNRDRKLSRLERTE